MEFVETIEKIIGSALEDMGYEIVRIQMQGSKRKTLQIMIDNLDGSGVTIDDCTNASRTISALLEVDDPIHDPYILEVSSPGVDRPLVKKADFERFTGENISLELKYPLEGRKRFQGVLKGLKKDKVQLSLEDGNDSILEFEYSDIQKAKITPDYE